MPWGDRLPVLTIKRFLKSEAGVYGTMVLEVDDKPVYHCFSVERGDKDNVPWVSCVPAGVYLAHRGTYKGRYEDLELDGVPGRSAIEGHIANKPTELNGCFAPNEMLRWEGDQIVGAVSGDALKKILASFDGDEIYVRVVDAD